MQQKNVSEGRRRKEYVSKRKQQLGKTCRFYDLRYAVSAACVCTCILDPKRDRSAIRDRAVPKCGSGDVPYPADGHIF